MRGYTQLLHEQRYQIYALMKAELKQTKNTEIVGVHKSTISRETRHNRGQRGYRPRPANGLAMDRCLTNPSGVVIATQNRLGKEIQIPIETLLLFTIATVIGVHWGLVGVATAILPCYGYFILRMTSLANSCIKGSYSDRAWALQPALLMNSALFVILAMTKRLLRFNVA